MAFEGILHLIINLHLLNVSTLAVFHQNRFINLCARKKKAKISWSPGFFWGDIEDLKFLIMELVRF